MNLNETWKLCLSMWRWIAKERRKDNTKDVNLLKEEWLQKHGFKESLVKCSCFFCEYSNIHKARVKVTGGGCRTCPGTKVDRAFDCMDFDYHFYNHPIAFYNKLHSLNRKRIAK